MFFIDTLDENKNSECWVLSNFFMVINQAYIYRYIYFTCKSAEKLMSYHQHNVLVSVFSNKMKLKKSIYVGLDCRTNILANLLRNLVD